MAGLRQLMREYKRAKTDDEREAIEDQILDFHEEQQRRAQDAYAELQRLRSLNTPGVGVGPGTPGWSGAGDSGVAAFVQAMTEAARKFAAR